MNFNFRLANSEDIFAIKGLMEQSIAVLLGNYVNEEELEASFESMGLDDQLILDKTYFLIDFEGILVGCGGWSNRKTLFGGNHTPNRSNDFLNPNDDAAKIIESENLYLSQGWTDLNARFGEPGLEYKEDLTSGMNAAAQGGFTHVALMPSTEPSIQTKSDVSYLLNQNEHHIVDLHKLWIP